MFQVLLFAKKYNLMVVIRSSGHSFIGRSGHDGGIVINLAKMKGLKFDLNSIRSQAGEVTVQSGNSWLDVYKAVTSLVFPLNLLSFLVCACACVRARESR